MTNISYFLKIFSFSIILSFLGSPQAYEFSVTNATGKDMAIEVYGILTGSMMQGKTQENGRLKGMKHSVYTYGNTIYVNNAGYLRGPFKIPKNHTAVLKFTARYIGICFNLSQIKVGLESSNFNMVPATVKALDNEWYDTIFGATQQAGDAAQNLGQAIGQVGMAIPDPKVQAIVGGVAAGTVAVGAFTDVIGKLVRSSSCKPMSFIAVEDKNRLTATLLTRQQ